MRLPSYNTLAPFLLTTLACPACTERRLSADGDVLRCGACSHELVGYEGVVELGSSEAAAGRWAMAEPPALLERFGAMEVEHLETWLSHWLKPAEGPVVDLQGGTGWTVRRLARWFGVARVLSLDTDRALLQQAHEDARDPGLAYLSGPLERLPFVDDSLGAVTCLALHRVSSVPALFRELRRTLAPGGSAAVMTPLRTAGWVGGVQRGLGMATGVRFARVQELQDAARAASLELRTVLPSKHLGLVALRRLM